MLLHWQKRLGHESANHLDARSTLTPTILQAGDVLGFRVSCLVSYMSLGPFSPLPLGLVEVPVWLAVEQDP